jgi:hypothetical protein
MALEDILAPLLKEVAVKGMVDFIKAKLFTLIPFLGWGPIGWVSGFIIGKVVDILWEEGKKHGDNAIIFLRNESNLKDFESASTKLYIIAKSKGIESEEFKNARKENLASLSQFVRYHHGV